MLKENPLLKKFLHSVSTAYFLDETFSHTHVLLFSTTISAAIVIKATKYKYSINIQYTKYSIISTKNVNLFYVVGSVERNNVYFHVTCLFPKYWKLLPLSQTFIDHAVKHRIVNFTVCLKYQKQKTKRNLQWDNRSWQSDWNLGCWNTLDTSTMTNSFT